MAGTDGEICSGSVPAAELTAHDLWRAQKIDRGQLSVELVFWVSGEPARTIPCWGPAPHSLENEGEFQRQFCFWQAAARYLNAGGDAFHLLAPLADIARVGALSPKPYQFLFATEQPVKHTRHVWVDRETHNVLIFTEDVGVRRMTIAEYHARVTNPESQRLHHGLAENDSPGDPPPEGGNPGPLSDQ